MFILLIPVSSATAMNAVQWRWLTGSSSYDVTSICGSVGQFSTSYSPGSRRNSAITVQLDPAVIFLFGGRGWSTSSTSSGELGDIWAYRHSSFGEWAWLGGKSDMIFYSGKYSGVSPYPGARRGARAWYVSDSVYIHGGYANKTGFMNDLWEFNSTSFAFKWLTGSSSGNPRAIYGVKGSYTSSNITIGGVFDHSILTSTALIFGGNGLDSVSAGCLADVWRYSRAQNRFIWLNGPSIRDQYSLNSTNMSRPGGRYGMTVMSDTNFVFVYGGWGFSASKYGYTADLWSYNVAMNVWSFISGEFDNVNVTASKDTLYSFDGASYPGSRSQAGGWIDPNSNLLLIVGGETSLGLSSDIFAFNSTSWAWIGGNDTLSLADAWFSSENSPGSTCQCMTCVNLGVMYMFGGHHAEGESNALWATKGPTVRVEPTPTPTRSVRPPVWRWMTGASTVLQQSLYTGSTSHPGARSNAAVWKNDVDIWAFGGYGLGASSTKHYLDEMWRYSAGTSQWTIEKRSGLVDVACDYRSGSIIGGRSSMVSWFMNEKLCVYGGYGYASAASVGLLSDVWCCTPSTGYSWQWIAGSSLNNQPGVYGIMGLQSGHPGARRNAAILYHFSDGSPLIHGGFGVDSSSNQGELGDMWKFSILSNKWSWMGPLISQSRFMVGVAGSIGEFDITHWPGARWKSVAVFDASTEFSYLIGGSGFSTSSTRALLADVWAIEINVLDWAVISLPALDLAPDYGEQGMFGPSTSPGGRMGSGGFAADGLIYLFAGHATSGYSDFFAMNVSLCQWAWVAGPSTTDHVGVYDSNWYSVANEPGSRHEYAYTHVDRFIVFGGIGSDLLNDVWETVSPFSPIPTPVPKVQVTVKFFEPPIAVDITWAAETDMGMFASMLVSTYFVSSAMFGVDATVFWPSEFEMRVMLGEGATVVPGDTIELKDGVVKVLNGRVYDLVHVIQSSGASAPVAFINAPTEVSACDGFTMVGIVNDGLFGRAPTHTKWSLLSSSASNTANVSAILAAATGLIVVIPSTATQSGAWYNFSLSMANIFGNYSDPVYCTVSINSMPIPSALLVGGPVFKIHRTLPLSLTMMADHSVCSSPDKLLFTWKQTSGPQISWLNNVRTSSFIIPANSLGGGNAYGITGSVWVKGNPSLNNTVSCEVQVQESDLVALISGGDRLLPPNLSIDIDGSQSYDPDTGDSDGMIFEWTWNNTVLGSSPVLQMFLPPSVTRLVKLTVSKNSRAASATVEVKTRASSGDVPLVSIDVIIPQHKVMGFVNGKSALVVNAGKYSNLVLRAVTAFNSTSIKYLWQIARVSQALRSFTAEELASSATREYIAVKSTALSDGSNHVIRVSAWDEACGTTCIGWAEYTLSVNSPPTPGSCKVTPTAGVAMKTKFTVQCVGWDDVDEDKPLVYSFGLVRHTASGEEYRELLGMFSTASVIENILLPASSGNTLSVRIMDRRGMAATVRLNVTVAPRAVTSLCSVTDAIAKESLSAGNTFGTVTAVGVCGDEVARRCSHDSCVGVSQTIQDMLDNLNLVMIERKFARTPATDLQVISALAELTRHAGISPRLRIESARLGFRLVNDSRIIGLDQLSPSVMLGIMSNVMNPNLTTLVEDSVRVLTEVGLKDHIIGQHPLHINSPKIDIVAQRGYSKQLANHTIGNAHLPGYLGVPREVDICSILWDQPTPFKGVESSVITVNVTRDSKVVSIRLDDAADPPVAVLIPIMTTFSTQVLTRVKLVRQFDDFAAHASMASAIATQQALSKLEVPIPTCQTRNDTAWNTGGCAVGGLFAETGMNVSGVICVCTHMSDFAVLLAISRDNTPPGSTGVPSSPIIQAIKDAAPVLYTYAALYIATLIISLVQLSRILHRIVSENMPMPTQSWIHGFVVVVAVTRTILLLIGATTQWQGLPFAVHLLLALLPMTALLGAYALVLFVLFGFSNPANRGQTNGLLAFLGTFQGPFIASIVGISGIDVLLVIIAAAVDGASQAVAIVSGILLILGSISIIVGLGLSISRLIRQLQKFQDVSEANRARIKGLAQRGFAFSFGLFGIAILTLLTMSTTLFEHAFPALYGLYTAFDLVCVSFLLYFHHKFARSRREQALQSVQASVRKSKNLEMSRI